MSLRITGPTAAPGRTRRPLIAVAALALLAAPLAAVVPATTAEAATPVTLNLLTVNDFHGRINNNTVKWAWKVQDLRQTTASDGGLMIGAGDLIGASEFASAVQNDQPTIDVMNEIGLDVSSVGNHEFDKGYSDLKNRVIGGGATGNPLNAQWDYLGANVYDKGTQNPVLPEYETYTLDGIRVAVIGAVTQETSSLVSPGGISTIDFGDPVQAVNRVAAKLHDGVNGDGYDDADVIIATFHAGAQVGVGSTYDAEVAKGGEFAEMANLDPEINAIVNGHTHQVYDWDAPVAGGDLPTRPILQTGAYAANVGQIVLTVDPDTKKVLSYDANNRAVPTTGANADYVAQYPSVLTPVNNTVNAALAYAAQVGNTPVGSVTADVTRAEKNGSYVNGKYVATISSANEDRGSESTIGDVVANALRDGLPADMGHADLGIVNPGGLRSDLLYAGDTTSNPANTDGVVTYAEANNVLPFVNNIWTIKLTGAELEQVLEQQWQPAGASRPFLALGLSDNVTVTQDPTAPVGSRITSVMIDGQKLDATKTYTVCTFSFLGTGGDNFSAFTQGEAKDTGLVDRDLWIGYLQNHAGIGPDFAKQQVVENSMPAAVSPGQAVSFSLSSLNLTSLGSPENTQVKAYARTPSGQIQLGVFPVSAGTATLSFTVPDNVPAHAPLVVVASPSMTTVGKGQSATSLTATAATMTYGTPGSVEVTVAPGDASGTVTVWDGTTQIGTSPVSGGTASVTVPGTALVPGTHGLTVSFSGDDNNSASSTAVNLTVEKATPAMTVAVSPSKVVRKKTTPTVTVTLTAPGQTVAGQVSVVSVGTTYLKSLSGGTADVALKPYGSTGTKQVVVTYLGNDLNTTVRKVLYIQVVNK